MNDNTFIPGTMNHAINQILSIYLCGYKPTIPWCSCRYLQNAYVNAIQDMIIPIINTLNSRFDRQFVGQLIEDWIPGYTIGQLFNFFTYLRYTDIYKIVEVDPRNQNELRNTLAFVYRNQKANIIFITRLLANYHWKEFTPFFNIMQRSRRENNNEFSVLDNMDVLKTLVHEISHRVLKTEDYAYGFNNSYNLAPNKKKNNADNFGYFACFLYLYSYFQNRDLNIREDFMNKYFEITRKD